MRSVVLLVALLVVRLVKAEVTLTINNASLVLGNVSVAISPVSSQSIVAATCSRADVVAAIALASDGDTVVIPAGTCSWTNAVILTNAITLQGAGIGQTIIQDDVVSGNLLHVTLVANKTTRITGLEFNIGARAEVLASGAVNLNGSNADNQRVRLDNCKFQNLNRFAFEVNGALGVIDNNTINLIVPAGGGYIRHSNFDGSSYGDGAWAAADQLGTDQFIFMEDNTITCTLAGWHLTTIDGWGGSRYVFRYNTLTRGSLEIHGTESAGRNRGGRAFEVYNNTFVGGDFGGIVTYMRSGVGIISSNTVSGYNANNNPLYLLQDRDVDAFPPFSTGNAEWAGSDGQNPWDVNIPGGPFATGTVTSWASGAQTCTLTVAGAPWTVNQWTNYSITRTSGKSISSLTRSGSTVTAACTAHGFTNNQVVSIRGAVQPVYNTLAGVTIVDPDSFTYTLDFGSGAPTTPATGTIYAIPGGYFSEISSSGTNTITYKTSVYGESRLLRFDAADTFALWKVDQSLDQPGRSLGFLLSGDTPSRPGGWNDQVTSAWYEWNNTREGAVDLGFSAVHTTIRENEHFYNNTAKPGYTPYVYPHPLRSQ